jgi:CRISPR-associated Cas5-like protein
MKPYPLQLEIAGPTALWTRPDTGSSPVSYVAPTFSAAKGIFEAILRWKIGERAAHQGGNLPARPVPSLCHRPGRAAAIPRRQILSASTWERIGGVSYSASHHFGPCRPETRIWETEHREPPTMLRLVFDQIAMYSQN